ncbi:MAG: hypothetical protein U5K00_22735 [Melioribacteraceae bacterium]|nr:hypothetical protein [Melioribacteraceae bacterium]
MYGDIYRSMGKVNTAIGYYEKGLEKSIDQDINYLIRYCYRQLTDLYKQTGRYKDALEALQSFTAYKDSVLNEEIRLKVAELEIDYQTEKKDREIAESKLEISEKTSQLLLAAWRFCTFDFSFLRNFRLSKKKKRKIGARKQTSSSRIRK